MMMMILMSVSISITLAIHQSYYPPVHPFYDGDSDDDVIPHNETM